MVHPSFPFAQSELPPTWKVFPGLHAYEELAFPLATIQGLGTGLLMEHNLITFTDDTLHAPPNSPCEGCVLLKGLVVFHYISEPFCIPAT